MATNTQATFDDITRARELFAGSPEMNRTLDAYLSPVPTRAELFRIAGDIKSGAINADARLAEPNNSGVNQVAAKPQTLWQQVETLELEHAALAEENHRLRAEVERLTVELRKERSKAGFGTGFVVGAILG